MSVGGQELHNKDELFRDSEELKLEVLKAMIRSCLEFASNKTTDWYEDISKMEIFEDGGVQLSIYVVYGVLVLFGVYILTRIARCIRVRYLEGRIKQL